jgi:hypothetical protein
LVKRLSRIAVWLIVAGIGTIVFGSLPLAFHIADPQQTSASHIDVLTPIPVLATATPRKTIVSIPPPVPPAVSMLRLLPALDAHGIRVDYRSNVPNVTLFVQDASDLQTFTAGLPGTGIAVIPVASLPKSGAFSIIVQARRGEAVGAAEILLPSIAFATAPLQPIARIPTAEEPITVTPRWAMTGTTITVSRYATLGTTTIAIKRDDETVELTTLAPHERTAFLEAPQVGRYTMEISTVTGASTDTSILPLIVMPTPKPTPTPTPTP